MTRFRNKYLLTILVAPLLSVIADASSMIPCSSFCRDGTNCDSVQCLSCDFACPKNEMCKLSTNQKKRCKMPCFNNYLNESNSCNNINFDCDACSICNVNSELDQCPIVIFKDITKYKLPKSDPYWHSWKHSGYPYCELTLL